MFLQAQICAMQVIQRQSESPETGSVFQQTESTEVIQIRNYVTGKGSKPKGRPIETTKHRESPKSKVRKNK